MRDPDYCRCKEPGCGIEFRFVPGKTESRTCCYFCSRKKKLAAAAAGQPPSTFDADEVALQLGGRRGSRLS